MELPLRYLIVIYIWQHMLLQQLLLRSQVGKGRGLCWFLRGTTFKPLPSFFLLLSLYLRRRRIVRKTLIDNWLLNWLIVGHIRISRHLITVVIRWASKYFTQVELKHLLFRILVIGRCLRQSFKIDPIAYVADSARCYYNIVLLVGHRSKRSFIWLPCYGRFDII